MRCFACGGPYHEASGHFWRDFDIAYCGRCTRHFFDWVRQHTRSRIRGGDFYAEAASSVRAR
jgi:hypothetical protein